MSTRIDTSAYLTAQNYDRVTKYIDRAADALAVAECAAPQESYIGAVAVRTALAEAQAAVDRALAVSRAAAAEMWKESTR